MNATLSEIYKHTTFNLHRKISHYTAKAIDSFCMTRRMSISTVKKEKKSIHDDDHITSNIHYYTNTKLTLYTWKKVVTPQRESTASVEGRRGGRVGTSLQ